MHFSISTFFITLFFKKVCIKFFTQDHLVFKTVFMRPNFNSDN